eukprot:TRINITY_DN2356_c0_g1_i1.p1 TRINITY_DN2356_c0_g1~~TRINITY_DN2356_c0_g1_i1.p1  ORF type:complete len:497 (-),score=194.46 TRINITY_DN2356_c0_g1_i1:214-1704(-)
MVTTTSTLGPGGGEGSHHHVAMAKLICLPDSHVFEDRFLDLSSPCKIGRTVVKAHPDPHNGIFDCKVLSRNHAVIWFDEPSQNFYIQDTKSSNGTYVNDERLSKGTELSEPRVIYSGDKLQFGVDVYESKNTHKVNHGCIIAKIHLILPNGEPQLEDDGGGSTTSMELAEVYELNQHLQEALVRERLLMTKLDVFQRLLQQTESASSETWQALINEDRLLSRIEILERQLSALSTDSQDKLKEELKWYIEEKESYQQTAKITLKKLVDEKLEAVKSVKDLRRALIHTQEEFMTLKQLYDKDLSENRRLTRQVTTLNTKLESLKKPREDKEMNTEPQTTSLQDDPSSQVLGPDESSSQVVGPDEPSSQAAFDLKSAVAADEEIRVLKEKLSLAESRLAESSGPSHEERHSNQLVSTYESNLIQAEKKIARLILVKEKYISLAGEKKLIEEESASLRKKLDVLKSQGQTALACYAFSFGILLLAIVLGILPYVSQGLF